MDLFYCRVSTEEQNEARQIEYAKSLGIADENIYIDKASGKNTERQQLKAMISFMRKGDTVIVESISRLARSTKDLLSLVEQFTAKGVEFISKRESIDTTTPQGKFMLTVFGAMAELERESILQRQAEGIAIAKSQGKYKGRKPIAINETEFKRVCELWVAGSITAVEAQKRLKLSPPTFYAKAKERDIASISKPTKPNRKTKPFRIFAVRLFLLSIGAGSGGVYFG